MTSLYTKLMARADTLTDFQNSFILMIQFIKEKNLLDELDEYVKQRWEEK